jgi:hypothetical protein
MNGWFVSHGAKAICMLLLLAGAAAAVSHGRWWRLPDSHNPWAPLSLQEPPGWLTRHKLRRLGADPEACLAWLATTPLQAKPVADRTTASDCGFTNAVQIRRTSVQVGEPFVLSCRAAASLALWEQHVLQPLAQHMLGTSVRQLQHYGSYACRNIYGRETGPRSQHSSADALDLAGFVLQDGRRITVARDWARNDEGSRFLREVHAGACGLFDGVLGPGYNAAHADHFHFDRGPYRVCR